MSFLMKKTSHTTQIRQWLRISSVALSVITSGFIPVAFAAVMGSTTYRMESDSINVGGSRGTSTTYRMEDTAGEVATGDSGSTIYRLHAGYQQMHDSMISISAGSDITLTALSLSQHSSVGSASWTVITDDVAGYTLSTHASSDPALADGSTGESFTDYTETIAGTPETWSVVSGYEFGFSGYGSHVSSATWGTDTDCINTTNVPSATLKWRGFDGTNDMTFASSNVRTNISGVATALCVATEQDSMFAPSGTYTGVITATAVAR